MSSGGWDLASDPGRFVPRNGLAPNQLLLAAAAQGCERKLDDIVEALKPSIEIHDFVQRVVPITRLEFGSSKGGRASRSSSLPHPVR